MQQALRLGQVGRQHVHQGARQQPLHVPLPNPRQQLRGWVGAAAGGCARVGVRACVCVCVCARARDRRPSPGLAPCTVPRYKAWDSLRMVMQGIA